MMTRTTIESNDMGGKKCGDKELSIAQLIPVPGRHRSVDEGV